MISSPILPTGAVQVDHTTQLPAQAQAGNLLVLIQQAAASLAAQFPGHSFTNLQPMFEMDSAGNVTVRVIAVAIPGA